MDAFGEFPSVTDGVQLSPMSSNPFLTDFITDVNTSIKSTDFLRRNSIMIIDLSPVIWPGSQHLAVNFDGCLLQCLFNRHLNAFKKGAMTTSSGMKAYSNC